MSLPNETYLNELAATNESQMGFCQVPNAIFQKGLSMGAITTYVYLLRRMNWSTGECYPSQVKMAELFDVSRNTIRKYLTELKEAKLITTKARKNENGRNGTHMYYLTLRVGMVVSDEGGVCAKSEHTPVQNLNNINDTTKNDSSLSLSTTQDCKSVEETKPSKQEREIEKEPEPSKAKGETCMDCDAQPNKGYPRCLSCHLKHQSAPKQNNQIEDKSIVRETPKVIVEQRQRDAKEKKLTKTAKQKRHEVNMEAMRQGFAKAKGDTQAQLPNATAPKPQDKIGGRTYKLREGFQFSCPISRGIARITRTDDDLYLNCSDDSCGVTKLDDLGLEKISNEKSVYTVDLTKKVIKSPQHKSFSTPQSSVGV